MSRLGDVARRIAVDISAACAETTAEDYGSLAKASPRTLAKAFSENVEAGFSAGLMMGASLGVKDRVAAIALLSDFAEDGARVAAEHGDADLPGVTREMKEAVDQLIAAADR